MVNGNFSPLRPNSVLLDVAPVIVTGPPVAFNEAVRPSVAPTTTPPKFMLVGPRSMRAPDVPLPATAIVRVGFGAYERTERCPFTAELDFGVPAGAHRYPAVRRAALQ